MLQRAEVVRVVEHRDSITVVGDDGTARRYEGDSAELVREILERIERPIAREALRADVAAVAGVDPASEEASVIDEAIDALVEAGVLGEPIARRRGAPVVKRARVVLGISGAVAAIDTPVLVRLLLSRGFDLEIAATPTALRFVGRAGLEALTHRGVHARVWPRPGEPEVPHITLAEWADAMVIYPATATTIARIACGDCSELVSAIAITTRAPVVIAPSMNAAMAGAPAVKRNLRLLRDDGMHIVHPGFGHEVAHAPEERRPMLGPAPPGRVVADLLEVVLRTDPRAARAPALPASPDGWDALHRLPPDRLPWHTETLDDDLGSLLDRVKGELPPNGDSGAPRLLDVGTGAGTAAIEAATRGFDVVASDVSAAALSRARARAGERAVTFVLDDVVRSTLRGPFDVIVDRACLHCLPRGDWAGYQRTMARLCAPGGWLLLKTHAPEQPRSLGTETPTAEELQALFGESFELVARLDSTLPGPVVEAPKALVSLFRRRA